MGRDQAAVYDHSPLVFTAAACLPGTFATSEAEFGGAEASEVRQ